MTVIPALQYLYIGSDYSPKAEFSGATVSSKTIGTLKKNAWLNASSKQFLRAVKGYGVGVRSTLKQQMKREYKVECVCVCHT